MFYNEFSDADGTYVAHQYKYLLVCLIMLIDKVLPIFGLRVNLQTERSNILWSRVDWGRKDSTVSMLVIERAP